LQTIEDIDEHLDFAIRRYNDNKQIRIAVDKVQTKVVRENCLSMTTYRGGTKSEATFLIARTVKIP